MPTVQSLWLDNDNMAITPSMSQISQYRAFVQNYTCPCCEVTILSDYVHCEHVESGGVVTLIYLFIS